MCNDSEQIEALLPFTHTILTRSIVKAQVEIMNIHTPGHTGRW